MLLFETPAGFALFKVLNEKKLEKVEVAIFILSSVQRNIISVKGCIL